MTKLNPSSSPSGPPLLSGPPTLTDIHQIFTRLQPPVCVWQRALPLELFVNRQLSNVKAGRSATCTSCATARTRPDPEQLKAQEAAHHFYDESRGQVDGMNRKVKNSVLLAPLRSRAERYTPATRPLHTRYMYGLLNTRYM